MNLIIMPLNNFLVVSRLAVNHWGRFGWTDETGTSLLANKFLLSLQSTPMREMGDAPQGSDYEEDG